MILFEFESVIQIFQHNTELFVMNIYDESRYSKREGGGAIFYFTVESDRIVCDNTVCARSGSML